MCFYFFITLMVCNILILFLSVNTRIYMPERYDDILIVVSSESIGPSYLNADPAL